DDRAHAAQRLERAKELVLFERGNQPLQFAREVIAHQLAVFDLVQAVLEDQPLCLGLEMLSTQPRAVSERPRRATLPDVAVTQEKTLHPLARPSQVAQAVLASAYQVAQGFVRVVGQADAFEVARAQQASELARVALVGLDPLARLL